MKNGVLISLVCLTLSCSPEGEDITNKTFTAQAITCTDYVGTYTSGIKDLANNKEFNGYLEISEGETCTYSTNSIPNHDVNDKARL